MLPVDFKNGHVPCHYICNFCVNFHMPSLIPYVSPSPVNIGSMLHVNLKKYPCSCFEYRCQEPPHSHLSLFPSAPYCFGDIKRDSYPLSIER